jgi:hypothetical protein
MSKKKPTGPNKGNNPKAVAAQPVAPCPVKIEVEFVTPGKNYAGSPNDDATSQDQNHYTFSTAKPGVLKIVLRARVKPGGKAAEAKDRVKFQIDGIGNSVLKWSNDAGGKATRVNGNFLETDATFTNLPKKNSDFGKKKAKLLFDGAVVDTREYLVFFPKKGQNHPGPNPVEPNWFYYWEEGQVCGINANCEYDATSSFGYCVPATGDTIHLGPDAPEANTGPETYDSGNVTYGSITVTGTGKGIKCVAETIEHEQCHIDNYKASKGKKDDDGDGVADTLEPNLEGIKSDPKDADTYKMGGSYSSYGDDEVRCRKKELNLTISYHTNKDWANPGCQSKVKFGPT